MLFLKMANGKERILLYVTEGGMDVEPWTNLYTISRHFGDKSEDAQVCSMDPL